MWDQLTTHYCDYLTAIGRPATTIGLRRYQITHLGHVLAVDPTRVTYDDVLSFFRLHDWKPETRRSYRAAIRGFFAWATKHGHLGSDPATELPQIRVPKASARPCPDTTYRHALAKATPREALMLRLAKEAGLRRAEIAQVHAKDLRNTTAGPSLLVHGKGSNERVVPITDGLAATILETANGAWCFPSQRGAHLTPRSVGTICSALLGDEVTLHQLRHTFATNAYRGSHNLRAVQKLLGHTNLATTERYLDADDSELRAAMLAAVA
jgi:integrase/recombinase XerC